MIWRDLYNRFKDQVLRQEIEGVYKEDRVYDARRVLVAVGLLNVALGLIALGVFAGINTQSIWYDTDRRERVFLKRGTHLLYIDIEQLFQNNLTYSKSISYDQLEGKTRDFSLKDCAPYDYVDGKPYYPAGIVANTYFQDVIRLKGLRISTEGIAWKREMGVIGKTGYRASDIAIPRDWTPSTNEGGVPLNTTKGSGLPVLDERFVNWIYLSTFPRFRKLWGTVSVQEAGSYSLEIESIFDFSKKSLYLTEGSWLGMKNYYLSQGLILSGALSVLAAFFFKRFVT